MLGAVYLDRHSLLRHPMTTYPVGGRTAATWTDEPYANGDPSECDPDDLNTFPLAEQLSQVGVVGLPIPGAGQVYDLGDHAVRRGIGTSSSPIAVSECGRSFLSVNRQKSPCKTCAHSHEGRCLPRSHLLRQKAVENLKSYHLSLVNGTLSIVRTFSLNS